ncbi:uncharacterized protein PFL1_05037 [Pseudozyma flocculosa PF-1]|uniref:Uncharacterized protein n=2 Tax=Pseudozyma flocculosa TaxID=84751 RepID=A0A5C3EWU3_9BASI|nr:uncharacterized protein PFL1_05037 [Pseudozyma flocculosa PF-1]EPQ27499.1 hypothetical protein PFL1_05037 [Pseudozyma flocculosa PF-1]SPO36066.1 uncharacterized protein PSFLO_01537 [Pseudozyma flocculosa]
MPHKRAKFSKRQEDRAALGTNLPPPTGKDDYHFNSMPKGAMRILQGAQIQEEYRKRKLAAAKAAQNPTSAASTAAAKGKGKGKDKAAGNGNDNENSSATQELKIRPGEKLRDFNRRVEMAMAHDISSTFRSKSATNAKKRARRAARKAGLDPDADSQDEADQEDLRKKRADKAAAKEAAQPSRNDLKRQRQALEAGAEVKDFAKASQVKKINDVAQAPPRLTKAPRGETVQSKLRKAQLMAKIGGTDEDEASRRVLTDEKARFKGRIPEKAAAAADAKKRKRGDDPSDLASAGVRPAKPSMARQMILDQERDKAIKLYRELKEKKIKERETRGGQ